MPDQRTTTSNATGGTVEIERRYTSGDTGKAELRADNGQERIGGYAAVFNRASRNLGGFKETVDPIAFNQSRGDGWPGVMARYNHTELIGTTAAGTLQLRTDQYGLFYEVEPPKSRGYVTELVQRGDVTKSSFAFRTINDDWTYNDGLPQRTLLGVHLVDVAPVDDPAYTDTSVGVRAAPESVEAALRSLAAKFEADINDVRSLAQEDELRRFFVRTDGPQPKKAAKRGMFGPAAAAAILARREDPYV
jgi:HK97 family phage prohead protease